MLCDLPELFYACVNLRIVTNIKSVLTSYYYISCEHKSQIKLGYLKIYIKNKGLQTGIST